MTSDAMLGLLVGSGLSALVAAIATRHRPHANAAQDSRARSWAAFASAQTGMAFFRADGRLLNANPALQRLLGYSESELTAMSSRDYTVAEDLELDDRIFAQLCAGDWKACTIEKRYRRKDGTVVWGRLTVSRLEGAAGDDAAALGMVEDITALKTAAQALARSEALYRAVVESTSDAVVVVDSSFRVQGTSGACDRLFGCAETAANDKSIYELISTDDHRALAAVLEARTTPDEPTAMIELQARCADGSTVQVECTVTNLLADRRVEGLVLAFRDTRNRRSRRAERELLRRVAEASAAATVIADSDGTITYANPAYRLLRPVPGSADGSPVGLPVDQVLADLPEVIARLADPDLGTWRAEVVHGYASGQVQRADVRLDAVYDASGRRVAVAATLTELTDQRRSEIALRASERRFQSLHAAAGFLTLGLDGKIIEANTYFSNLLGPDPPVLTGRYYREFVHPEDWQIMAVALRQLEFGIREAVQLQQRFETSAGRGAVGLVSLGLILGPRGEPSHVLAMVQDISDHVRLGEELRHRAEAEALLAETSSHLLTASATRFPRVAQLVLERVAQHFETETAAFIVRGAESSRQAYFQWPLPNYSLDPLFLDAVVERMVHQYQSNPTEDNAWLVADAATAGDDIESDLLVRYAVRSVAAASASLDETTLGVLVTTHLSSSRTWSQSGVALLQVVADLLAGAWQRLQVETAVRQARDEAERASRAKSEFLSRTSHELRTPLNAILGFAQLLQLELEDDDQQEGVGHILRAGRHLLGLIDDILDISQIEADRLHLVHEAVDLKALADECGVVIRPLAAQYSVDLHLATGLAATHVHADRRRLRQSLLNLLTNAVKYGGGGCTVTLSWQRRHATVRILVADTGPGIPLDRQHRLFEPFDRLGAEATTVEGTGLDLAVTKRLVEAMDGQIGVVSAPGAGATFWIDLPAADDRPHEARVEEAALAG